MAQVPLTPVQLTSASIVETLVAPTTGTYPSGGNSFANTVTTELTVAVGAVTPTMTVSWTRDGVVVTRTTVFTATTRRRFRFSPQEYGATVNIHFDAIASITVGVFY
jgi:hypothetical protein